MDEKYEYSVGLWPTVDGDGETVVVEAHAFTITDSGALVFVDRSARGMRAFAAGQWATVEQKS